MRNIRISGWGVLWRSENSIDGKTEYLMRAPGGIHGLPRLFQFRREARDWIKEEYGYIRCRPDLQAEPKAVYVTIAGTIDWR